MADVYEASEVLEGLTGMGPAWDIVYVKPDGGLHHFVIPKFAFTSQAIEYDMSLDDEFELVVDTLMHSLWVPPTWEIKNDDRDPGWAAGYRTTVPTAWEAADDTDSRSRRPVSNVMVSGTLWTAETVKDAREAHDLRVQYVKENKVTVDLDSMKNKGMNKLYRERDTPHPMGNAARREHIRKNRKKVRGRDDGNPLKPGKVTPKLPKR